MNEHSELKKLAEAATPGPWVAEKDEDTIRVDSSEPLPDIIVWCGSFGDSGGFNSDADKEYIAASNPDAVLALIAEVEGLRAQHGRDSKELRSLCQARDDARKDRDQLKAEVARSTEREIMQLAEIEALRKAVEFGADCFRKISSGDGSGHADLAESILRIAGSTIIKVHNK